MHSGGMRKIAISLSALLLGGVVGGCASVNVHPVSVAQVNDPSISGVRFFQPAPYLLVTQMPAMPAGHHPMMLARGMMGPHGPMMGGPVGPGPRVGKGHGDADEHAEHGNRGGKHEHGDDDQAEHHGKKHAEEADHDKKAADHDADDDGHKAHFEQGHKHHAWGHGHMAMGRHGMRPGMKHLMMRLAHHAAKQRVYCLQIIYLPDYSHPFVADIKGGMGHSPNSLVLANGWQLLGINNFGRIAPTPPIRAITVAPAGHHPHPMGPMGPMAMHCQYGWKGHHGMAEHRMGHKGDQRPMMGGRRHHGMPGMHSGMRPGMNMGSMMHRMMMARHTARAIGLKPGLYQFVFNAKTGKLKGLRLVHLMHPKHHGRMHGRKMGHGKWMHGKHHGHGHKHGMKKPVATPATTQPA